jgi:hypothetical protein
MLTYSLVCFKLTEQGERISFVTLWCVLANIIRE